MDHQKIGAFLKQLRKGKGLTQEQLAEHFHLSSRTVSRWETGSNMPPVDMLIDLADFYNVDIREILDGERKSQPSKSQANDTLKRITAYAIKEEKRTQSKAAYIALGTAIAVLICSKLFSGETTGLLYGIVPENICRGILLLVYGITIALAISYLKAHWFLEKPSSGPEQSVIATVISKEVTAGTHQTGRSKGGFSYVIRFLTKDGQPLDLYAYEVEFGSLKEGMCGLLTFQGRYFVRFQENVQNVD